MGEEGKKSRTRREKKLYSFWYKFCIPSRWVEREVGLETVTESLLARSPSYCVLFGHNIQKRRKKDNSSFPNQRHLTLIFHVLGVSSCCIRTVEAFSDDLPPTLRALWHRGVVEKDASTRALLCDFYRRNILWHIFLRLYYITVLWYALATSFSGRNRSHPPLRRLSSTRQWACSL